MSQTQTRSLVLRSYDINPSNVNTVYFSNVGAAVVTAAGSVADNRNTMIWNNVNFRQAMGDTYYEKYNKFHIRLNSFWQGQCTTSVAAATAATTDARSVSIYLSGLPFEPSPYNQGSSSKTGSRVQLCNAVLPILATTAGQGVGAVVNYADGQSPSYTFSKTSDNPTIMIQMVIANTQTAYQPLTNLLIYGHTEFMFEIHGIPDDDTATTNNPNLMRR
jgi:hypothetical protein